MNFLNALALVTFILIAAVFFLIRSRPIVFHLICAFLIAAFVNWTGRTLMTSSIGEWILLTVGLILYWFGLVIVRVMLTRSVSLQMLSDYDRGQQTVTASEGIAGRLNDARQFGLVIAVDDEYKLTPFGRMIGAIVASSYVILRIK